MKASSRLLSGGESQVAYALERNGLIGRSILISHMRSDIESYRAGCKYDCLEKKHAGAFSVPNGLLVAAVEALEERGPVHYGEERVEQLEISRHALTQDILGREV